MTQCERAMYKSKLVNFPKQKILLPNYSYNYKCNMIYTTYTYQKERKKLFILKHAHHK